MVMASPEDPQVRPVMALIDDLEILTDKTPLIEEVQLALKKFNRLLNPIFMMLCQEAMAGNEIKDDQYIFTFMGSGSSDYSSVAQFRELMGDERPVVEMAGESDV